MTCIVGLVEDGTVYVGADSFTNDGSVGTARTRPKVFRLGSMVMAFSGSVRVGQVVQYMFEPPEHPKGEDGLAYLVRRVIPALQHCFQENGLETKIKEDDEGGWTMMMGYGGHLYSVSDDFAVLEVADGIDACGCGYLLALGALYATEKLLSGRARVLAALEAAARVDLHVRGPFAIEEVTG
jgi:ATP-dependent protease HslVU (ClpYQ) peptidase subunit